MTAQFLDTLFLGLLTYLAHSTVFLGLGLAITSLGLMKNLSLKEMILRFALFGALITTPLHMSGGFDSFFQPITLSEQTLKSDPAPYVLNEPRINEGLPATIPQVTTDTEVMHARDTGSLISQANPAPSIFTLTNILLMVWVFFGLAFLLQLFYLVIDLKAQLSGRVALEKGRAVAFAKTLAAKAGIPTPHISVKKNLAGPFCLGTGEIVLPEWAEDLPSRQLKAMIAHEVAHIMRADPAWVLAARVVQSVFFFQPLNLVAARKLSDLSEFACDAWAGKMCGSGMPLAECLAECAKRHLGKAPSALSTAMATKRSPIVERTHLLLAGIRDYSKPASRLSKVVVISAFVVGGTMIPVFAFDDESDKALEDALHLEEDALHLEEEALHLEEEALHLEAAEMAKEAFAMEAEIEEMAKVEFITEAEAAEMVKEAFAMEAEIEKMAEVEFRMQAEAAEMAKEAIAMKAELKTMAEEAAAMLAEEAELMAEIAELVIEEKSFKQAMADDNSSSSSSHIWHDDDGITEIKISYEDDHSTMKIRAEGRFKGNDEETGFTSMDDGSYFDIRETKDGETRRVRFEGSGGGVAETFWLNGDKTEKDKAMTKWLAEVIPAMYRQTGIDAEVRVNRIYKKGGTEAVLDEIALIPGSYTLRKYAVNLSTIGKFNDGQVDRLIDSVKGRQSSYDLRITLTEIANNIDLSQSGWKSFAEAVLEISSSYDRRITLSQVAEAAGKDTETREILIKAVAGVDSDYDKRITLMNLSEKFPSDFETTKGLASVAKTISSDYDLRVTLMALAERKGYDEAGWLALLDAVNEISSDYDARVTLIAFAGEMPRTSALEAKYRELLKTIRAENDRKQAENAL